MENKPNLLFYSKTIPQCIELINLMKQYFMDKEFKIICVDGNNNPIVKKIKEIPTLIIPSINQILTNDDVYNFIVSIIHSRENEKKKQIENKKMEEMRKEELKRNEEKRLKYEQEKRDKIQKNNKQNIDERKEIIKPKIINEQPKELLPYIEDEMSGLSDKYSYLNIDISPIHTYGYYQ